MVKNTRNQQVRSGVALPPVKKARLLSQTQESVKKLRTMQSATLPSLSRETILQSNSQDSATSTWSQTHKPRRYAGSNKGTPALSRTSQSIETRYQARMKTITFLLLSYPADPFHQMLWGTQKRWMRELVILLSQLLTNNRTTLYSIPLEAQKTAPLLVCSSIATTPCRSAARQMLDMCSDLQTHVMRQARIEVTAAYALNYLELRVLKLSKLLQDFVYLRQDPRNFLNSVIAAIIARAFYNNRKWGISFLSANMMALVGTVLYNAIKEYYDDGTRKTIYFHSYTVETIHANYIENSGSNVTVPDDYHDNDVDDILIKYTDNKRQRYNTLIEDYNCAGKREDNILTIDECRTGHSNKKDIEADEREEETRVRLRELSGEIHDILLREFRGADNFTESITHNDDDIITDSTWDEFAILAEEYTIDNRIIYALPEDCDALVERYEEEINCSDLYSTV
ncbi:hypothetical protein HBI09_126760 [Parastagonospora nodorum]|nr:hypothetical protein HBI09_126760 [Parastagonospora nodorum]KAH5003229.1 hypothetical protein HBI77_130910 [Parastagonospora nodorum]